MNSWVKKNGICDESAVSNVIGSVLSESGAVLAYFSGSFRSCRGDKVADLLKNTADLLEVRAFDSEQELWLHRSTLGTPFAWRLADEKGCAPGDFFRTTQALDIDAKYKPYQNGETDEYGCLKLRSTVMGCYVLPIERSDGCVQVVNYVRYDENGVAGVADYRIAGFAPLGKEAASDAAGNQPLYLCAFLR